MMKSLLLCVCLPILLSTHTWAGDASTVKVEVLAKADSSWDGDALPGYVQGITEVTILKVSVPPKVQLPLHKHLVINAGVLLKGELTVVTEDKETLHLKAGDPIIEVVDTWHYGKNEGDEVAEIIVFYAGIKGMPITVKGPGGD